MNEAVQDMMFFISVIVVIVVGMCILEMYFDE